MCVQTCKEPRRDETCGVGKGKCIEGCYCNKGYLWDGLKCVQKENCGCVYEDTSYAIDETFYKKECSEKCTCTGIGEEKCRKSRCIEKGNICELDDKKEYQCKKAEIPGISMHLGRIPTDEPDTNTTTKKATPTTTTTTTKTTSKIPLQMNDMGVLEPDTISMEPFVQFPDCLPKFTWKSGTVKPDWIPPNSCCGQHPYNDNVQSCCNNRRLFDEREEKCCRRHGTVVKLTEQCRAPERKSTNPKIINMMTINL